MKNCYTIVNKENGSFLLDSGRLPIYWMKKVATEVPKEGYKVVSISLDKRDLVLKN